VGGLVEDLRRLVGGGPAVYERLVNAGWRADSPAEVEFELRERRVHAVQGAFPRLVPEMIAGGVPPGVVNVRYAVNLDAADTPPMTDAETDVLFQSIATRAPQ
jgi:hypothetical protein